MKRLLIQFNAAIVLLFVFSFHCWGADKYTLEYNLEKGKTYTQHFVSGGNISVNAMGQEMTMNIKMDMNVQYNVIDRTDSVYNIRMLYQRIKMDMSGPMSYTFDSDSTAASSDNNVAEILKSLTGISFDVQLTKLGKVLSVKGLDKLTEKINAIGNAQYKQMVGQQFSEAMIQRSIEQTSSFFPGKPAAIGDNWDIAMNINANGIDIIVKLQTTLKEVQGNVAVLGFTGTVTTPEGGTVTKINGMDAKVVMDGTQTGTIRLNLKTGWNISSEINQKTTSNIEVMGQSMQQKMDMKTTVTGE